MNPTPEGRGGMRVMHVLEAMHRGGAESLVVEHARHAAPDVETLVVALNRGGPALEAAAAAGARTFVLGKRGARAGGLARLAGLMRAERVNVVNGHNPTGALYAVAAARLAGISVTLRTEHSLHYPGRHSIFYPLLEPLATALTRRVVCVCRAVLESHVSRLPWAARRFVTVANGISPAPHTRPREAVRREFALDPTGPVVLAVGSLTPQKSHDLLLEAFATAVRTRPGALLLIAGEGRLRGALEARIEALGLGGSVRLLGERDDVADLMAAADLFVLSSVREGLSVTLLEAMRAGLAAVVTRVGGNAEAVLDRHTGRIVPAGVPAALAAALAEMLGDPAGVAAMGAAARERWSQHFTAERMVRETEALYRIERALARHSPAAAVRIEERHGPA